jgi:protein-tyrosine phosphatase
MIDLHCHLLPAIDDGPETMSESLEFALAQLSVGVSRVACTPHVDWQYANDAGSISSVLEALRAALDNENIPLEVVGGAELGLTKAAEMPGGEIADLRLGGGPWILLEAPLSGRSAVESAVSSVAGHGHRILLAHPERSPAFQRDINALRRLIDGGARTQITASSLTGAFGSRVQRFAHQLMRENLIHVAASDAHGVHRRQPGLREHLIEAGFADRVQYLTEDSPAAVLAGQAVTLLSPRPLGRHRSWWRRSA